MKFFLHLLKWLFLCLLGIFLIVFLLLACDRDRHSAISGDVEKGSIVPQKEIEQDVDSSHYYTLLEEFGTNKKLAEGFEWQCLLALSHYPELKETPISFLVKPAFLPLASRPDPVSILFPWIDRQYLVIISSASEDFFEPILLQNTPFNEQIGIIGHELAHTTYYLDKNSLQIVKIAYNYQFDNQFRIEFEREADKIAIAHGLGYQMYDFAFFVRKAFGDTQEKIASEEGNMYLSPKEIAAEMDKYSFYREPLDSAHTYFIK